MFHIASPAARNSDPLSSHIAAEEVTVSGKRAFQQQTTAAAVKRYPGKTSRELSAADAGPDDPDELVPGEGFEAIEVLQEIAEKLGVPCTQEAIDEALDELQAKAAA